MGYQNTNGSGSWCVRVPALQRINLQSLPDNDDIETMSLTPVNTARKCCTFELDYGDGWTEESKSPTSSIPDTPVDPGDLVSDF